MPGIAQAKLDSSGMKARPESPDASHEAIEHERGARQVAGILERENEQEQDQDLRQEHQHAAGAGDHAIEQQPAQRARRQHAGQPAAERLHAEVDEVLRRLRPAEHRLEHQEQHRREQQRAGDRMEHHRIEARRAPQGAPARGSRCRCSTRRTSRCVASISAALAARGRSQARRRLRERALLANRRRRWPRTSSRSPPERTATVGITGTPSARSSALRVELVAALLGDIAHVERDDHRPARGASARAPAAG